MSREPAMSINASHRPPGAPVAGFVVSLGGPTAKERAEGLRMCLDDGVYGPFLPEGDRKRWGPPTLRAIGDMASMLPGDNIYFFQGRNLYGVGTLVAVADGDSWKTECVFVNWNEALDPLSNPPAIKQLVYSGGLAPQRQRVLCAYDLDERYETPIDMDDLLVSAPGSFRMLPFFSGRSLIKVDPEENSAIRRALYLANPKAQTSPQRLTARPARQRVAGLVKATNRLEPWAAVAPDVTSDSFASEAALELILTYLLTRQDPTVTELLGEWAYVSHQVVASPFKPSRWADVMDILGTRYIREEGLLGVPERHTAIELKKDRAARRQVIQAMKYVDWLRDKYANDNLDLVEGVLLAHDFSARLTREDLDSVRVRRFTTHGKSPKSREWSLLRLVRYRIEGKSKLVLSQHLG